MKILFLPRYHTDAPSSRYRTYNYIQHFEKLGIECTVQSLMQQGYMNDLNNNKGKNSFRLLKLYFQRFIILRSLPKFDFIYIEKELFPYLPAMFEYLLKCINVKYIVDYDDATFHDYDEHKNAFVRFFYKNKIAKVIAHSQYTITGSPYLTKYAQKFNQYVEEIPTSIDLEKYSLTETTPDSKFVIGWIGSKTTSKHVISIAEALRQFSQKHVCTVRLIGFDKALLSYFKDIPVEVVEWSEKEEVNCIKTFSVGIMPLIDAPFERGKCGFKLIQYMACGIPTISTPLETNVKINRDNINLFAADTEEWVSAFAQIYHNQEKYIEVGLKNRKIVETYYSIQANVGKYVALFNNLIKLQTDKN